MMKRIFLIPILALLPLLTVNANDNDAVKKQINSIKKNNIVYLYGEATAETEEEARGLAEEILYQSINEWIANKKKMQEKGWELGEDLEELFEYSMHPSQYEAYKSGKAKADFEKDLAERKAKKNAPAAADMPKSIKVSVNGQTYEVNIAYGAEAPAATTAAAGAPVAAAGEGEDVLAPLEGKFFRTKDERKAARLEKAK